MNRKNFMIKQYYNRSENITEYHLYYRDRLQKKYYGMYLSSEDVHDKINNLLTKRT